MHAYAPGLPLLGLTTPNRPRRNIGTFHSRLNRQGSIFAKQPPVVMLPGIRESGPPPAPTTTAPPRPGVRPRKYSVIPGLTSPPGVGSPMILRSPGGSLAMRSPGGSLAMRSPGGSLALRSPPSSGGLLPALMESADESEDAMTVDGSYDVDHTHSIQSPQTLRSALTHMQEQDPEAAFSTDLESIVAQVQSMHGTRRQRKRSGSRASYTRAAIKTATFRYVDAPVRSDDNEAAGRFADRAMNEESTTAGSERKMGKSEGKRRRKQRRQGKQQTDAASGLADKDDDYKNSAESSNPKNGNDANTTRADSASSVGSVETASQRAQREREQEAFLNFFHLPSKCTETDFLDDMDMVTRKHHAQFYKLYLSVHNPTKHRVFDDKHAYISGQTDLSHAPPREQALHRSFTQTGNDGSDQTRGYFGNSVGSGGDVLDLYREFLVERNLRLHYKRKANTNGKKASGGETKSKSDDDDKTEASGAKRGETNQLASKSELNNAIEKWVRTHATRRKRELRVMQRKRAKEMFEMLDFDRSNSIDAGELRAAMNTLGFDVSLDEVMFRISRLPLNEDGELSFESFLAGYSTIGTWVDLYRTMQRRRAENAKRSQRAGANVATNNASSAQDEPSAPVESTSGDSMRSQSRSRSRTGTDYESYSRASRRSRSNSGTGRTNSRNSSRAGSRARRGGWNEYEVSNQGWDLNLMSYLLDIVNKGIKASGFEHLKDKLGAAVLKEDKRAVQEAKRKYPKRRDLKIPRGSSVGAVPTRIEDDSTSRRDRTSSSISLGRSSRSSSRVRRNSPGIKKVRVRSISPRINQASQELAMEKLEKRRRKQIERNIQRSNKQRNEVPLPFFLWVPAYHRTRVLNEMTDPNRQYSENRIYRKGLKDLSALQKEQETKKPEDMFIGDNNTVAQSNPAEDEENELYQSIVNERLPPKDPIVIACKRGNWEEVFELVMASGKTNLERRAYVNRGDQNGSTPLLHAIWPGHSKVAEVLLHFGAIPDKPNMRMNTPLHLACERGHTDIIQLLLWKGASLSIQNIDGLAPTAMMYKNDGFDHDKIEQLTNFIQECRKKPSYAYSVDFKAFYRKVRGANPTEHTPRNKKKRKKKQNTEVTAHPSGFIGSSAHVSPFGSRLSRWNQRSDPFTPKSPVMLTAAVAVSGKRNKAKEKKKALSAVEVASQSVSIELSEDIRSRQQEYSLQDLWQYVQQDVHEQHMQKEANDQLHGVSFTMVGEGNISASTKLDV